MTQIDWIKKMEGLTGLSMDMTIDDTDGTLHINRLAIGDVVVFHFVMNGWQDCLASGKFTTREDASLLITKLKEELRIKKGFVKKGESDADELVGDANDKPAEKKEV